MPTFKHYKIFFQIIAIFQILNIFLITSCTLKSFKQNNTFDFDNTHSQLKKLIIPKGVNLPDTKDEYTIPYSDKDLEKKNYDIFPPI